MKDPTSTLEFEVAIKTAIKLLAMPSTNAATAVNRDNELEKYSNIQKGNRLLHDEQVNERAVSFPGKSYTHSLQHGY